MGDNKNSDLLKLIDKKCYTTIYDAVSRFIEDNPDELDLRGASNFIDEPDAASLNEMELIKTCNVVVDEDVITFDMIVSCEIEIEETVRRNRETDGATQWFRIRCKALLEETLKSFEVIKIEVYTK